MHKVVKEKEEYEARIVNQPIVFTINKKKVHLFFKIEELHMSRLFLFALGIPLYFCLMGCKKDNEGIHTDHSGRCENASIVVNTIVHADTIVVEAQGGQGPYTYSVDGKYFSFLNKFIDLSLGEYRVFVQDANRCYGVAKATVEYKAEFYDARSEITYPVVKKGQQVWMGSNLRHVVQDSTWCYDDFPENCEKNGALYGWKVASNVCPSGWRLPAVADFDELTNALAEQGDVYALLTEEGRSGFNLRPSGWKSSAGYSDEGKMAALWTSDFTVNGSDTTYTAFEVSTTGSITLNTSHDNQSALSVRCIRK